MVCQQLSVSRCQLQVWLKRDQLEFDLQTQPGRGRETVLLPAAKRVMKIGSKKRLQPARKLARRITKTSYKTSPGYSVIHTEADAKTNRKATNPLPEVRARARALSEEDWQKLVWLDKSPFEVFHPPNRHSPHYDRAWVARSSGEVLLRKERLYFFLVILLGKNCQVTPAVTHTVPRSDVTPQGQVSRIVRTRTLGAVSLRFPAPTVRKVRARADMAKQKSMSGSFRYILYVRCCFVL